MNALERSKKQQTKEIFQINVSGSNPIEALTLAIWAAFDAERTKKAEKENIDISLIFDFDMAKSIAIEAIQSLFSKSTIARPTNLIEEEKKEETQKEEENANVGKVNL